MIRRQFVYLSIIIAFICFITSCKKDSPVKEHNSSNVSIKENTSSKKDKENLVIRDDKTLSTESDKDEQTNLDAETSESDGTTGDNSIETEETKDTRVYDVAEQLPEFPGGLDALHKYLADKTSVFKPKVSINNALRTMVSFVIETDGSLSALQIAKSSGNTEFDEVAKNIVLHMPSWKPAENDGVTVRMKYIVPVIYNPAQ